MQLTDNINNLIEKPEKMEESKRELLFGGLTENYKYPDEYVYKELTKEHRSTYKIGEYQEILDPCSDCPQPLIFIYKFYGEKYLIHLRKELKDFDKPSSPEAKKVISPELRRDMKKIYDVKRSSDEQKPANSKTVKSVDSKSIEPKLEPKESPASSTINHHDEKHFFKTPRKLIKKKKYREVFKGPNTVWEWLVSMIIRKGWNDTEGYPLKEKYYDNGFLVCSYSISKIAEVCGMSKSTVTKYLKIFEEAGVIGIEYLKPKGKKRGQSVFILGEWKNINGQYEEILYRNEAFD